MNGGWSSMSIEMTGAGGSTMPSKIGTTDPSPQCNSESDLPPGGGMASLIPSPVVMGSPIFFLEFHGAACIVVYDIHVPI